MAKESTWSSASLAARALVAMSSAAAPTILLTVPKPLGMRTTTDDADVTGTLESRRATARASRTDVKASTTAPGPPPKNSPGHAWKMKTTGGSPPRPGLVSAAASTVLFPRKAVAWGVPVSNSMRA